MTINPIREFHLKWYHLTSLAYTTKFYYHRLIGSLGLDKDASIDDLVADIPQPNNLSAKHGMFLK
jgi:hypothetical protein